MAADIELRGLHLRVNGGGRERICVRAESSEEGRHSDVALEATEASLGFEDADEDPSGHNKSDGPKISGNVSPYPVLT